MRDFIAEFRIVNFSLADLDLLDTDPPENALKFKMSKQEYVNNLSNNSAIIERIISKLGNGAEKKRMYFFCVSEMYFFYNNV